LFTNVKIYIIFTLIGHILSLIVNKTNDFDKHAYVHYIKT